VTLIFRAVIIAAVSFTSTFWRRDEIFAPYTASFNPDTNAGESRGVTGGGMAFLFNC
jgi:hypothetical protein